MGVGFLDPIVDISPPTSSSFHEVDLSPYIPVGSTGVIIRVRNASGISNSTGWRKKGSIDQRTNAFTSSRITWVTVGVDEARTVELYRGSTNVSYFLIGYFDGDTAQFFTNAIDMTPPTTGGFEEVDISTVIGGDHAIAACLEITGSDSWGVRKKGSTDEFVGAFASHSAAVIGVDESGVFEAYVGPATKIYLVGYIRNSAILYTNSIEHPTTVTGWRDLPALPQGAVGGIYKVMAPVGSYGLRKQGATETVTGAGVQGWGLPACDTVGIVEANASSTSTVFHELGYFIPEAATIELSGTSAAFSAIEASLIKDLSITGSVAVESGAQATLARSVPLAGDVAATGLGLAAFSMAKLLTGSSAAQTLLDGAITVQEPGTTQFHGRVEALSANHGAFGVERVLSGRMDGLSSSIADVGAQRALAGPIESRCQATGRLVLRQALHGQIEATVAVWGTLERPIELGGRVEATSSLLDLSPRLVRGLRGDINAKAALAGDHARHRSLVAHASGIATTNARVHYIASFQGKAQGLVLAQAGLSALVPLAVAIHTQSSTQGLLVVVTMSAISIANLEGSHQLDVQVQGQYILDIDLVGDVV